MICVLILVLLRAHLPILLVHLSQSFPLRICVLILILLRAHLIILLVRGTAKGTQKQQQMIVEKQ